MTVYVDDAAIMYKGKLRYHMMADTLEELHAFCAKIGIKRCWFHKTRRPHYDITDPQKEIALQNDAVQVTSEDLVMMFRPKLRISL